MEMAQREILRARLDELPRVPDWPARLHKIVAAWATRPFRWGEADCVRFSVHCVEALLGVRLVLPCEAWHSAGEARARLRRMNGLLEAVIGVAGPPRPPTTYRDGDLAYFEDPRPVGERLAVIWGRWALGPSDSGLVPTPAEEARLVFWIGR